MPGQIKSTPYYSFAVGTLPKGCQLCVKGAKMVLYVTGICGNNCAYCPLSQSRRADRMWADEWPIENYEEMARECELIGAEGCGITGGDPLVR
ncbi:MAG: radical SAM protein, partial [Nanoarchaeota archaeon]